MIQNERPWMTALEMQFAALRTVAGALDRADAGDPPPETYLKTCAVACYPLKLATAYAWNHETATAVLLASRSIPANSVISSPRLPEGVRHAWWWFEQPLPIWQKDHAGGDTNPDIDRKHVVAMLCIGLDHGGVALVGFRWLRGSGPIPGAMLVVGSGTPLLNVQSDAQSTPALSYAIDAVRFFLAACVWLEQRVCSINSGPVERHRRKQLAREHNAPLPSDVKVVQLRRTESRPSSTPDSESIEWSCRWIVSGHWRNQIYANNEHKLIYILPYVKGPDDKPLKVPTHTVYQVSR